MKDIPKWLAERLPQAKETVEDDEPSNPERNEHDTTLPDLETLDPDLSDTDKSTGSDPDDTINMDKNQ